MELPPKCLICHSFFSYKENKAEKEWRIPYLLDCGHVFCFSCLKKTLKLQPENLVCFKCDKSTQLKVAGSLRSLQQDTFSLGMCLQYQNSAISNVMSDEAWKVAAKYSRTTTQPSVEKVQCRECQEKDAACFCKNCEVPMCDLCFHKIHSTSKVLRKHQTIELGHNQHHMSLMSRYSDDHQKMCATHSRPIEFLCTVDGYLVCSACIVSPTHSGHHMETLEDKNKQSIALIESLEEESQASLDIAKQTKQEMCVILSKLVVNKDEVLQNVQTSFNFFHSLLQCKEKELKGKIHLWFSEQTQTLNSKKQVFEEFIENAETTLTGVNKVISLRGKQNLNFENVSQTLRNLVRFPCHADLKEITLPTRCLLENEDILLKAISELDIDSSGHQQSILSGEIKFSKLSDVPEVVQNIRRRMTADSQREFNKKILSSESVNCPQLTYQGPPHPPHQQQSVSATNTNRRFKENNKISKAEKQVYVSHITDPCDFYVQTSYNCKRLKVINNEINAYCNSFVQNKREKQEFFDFSEGEIVFGRYGKDDVWYRARITGAAQNYVDLFYVDYGNIETVSSDSILPAPQKYQKIPDLSEHCSLADIVPTSGRWNAEAVQAFSRISMNKAMRLIILKEKVGLSTLVDLCSPVCDGISSECYTSVRDSLVFLGHVLFNTPRNKLLPPGTPPRSSKFYDYPSSPLPSIGSLITALVTHVESPGQFYIQEMSDDINNLEEEMSSMYSLDVNHLYTFVNPCVGDLCVAEYSEDRVWYRAKVIEIVEAGKVKVKYVDYGNKEILSTWKIKKIKDAYVTIPLKAFECKLADVIPKPIEDGDGQWCKEAAEFLSDFKNSEHVSIFIKEHLLNNVMSVYMKVNNYKKTVNDVLADKDWALYSLSCTGSLTSNGFFQEPGEMKRNEISQNKVMNVIKIPHKKAISVEVILVVSPGEFYVQLPTQKVMLERLAEDVQTLEMFPGKGRDNLNRIAKPSSSPITKMSSTPSLNSSASKLESPASTPIMNSAQVPPVTVNSEIDCLNLSSRRTSCTSSPSSSLSDIDCTKDFSPLDTATWLCGDHCLTWNKDIKIWCRAVVKALDFSHELATAHFYDYGFTQEVPITSLHPLPDFFKTPPLAIRCHLADVTPAGDITKWSHTSKDEFTQILQSQNCLFSAILGENHLNGESTSAELFFEGNEGQQFTVSQFLKERGLALPKRKSNKHKNGKTSEVSGSESDMSLSVKRDPPGDDDVCTYPPAKVPTECQLPFCFTHISSDGTVYGQEWKRDLSEMALLMDNLDGVYKDSVHEDGRMWKKGELACCRFYEDGSYYRAKILNVDSILEIAQIVFVDYGNVEAVSFKDLRPPLFVDIPILCYVCELSRISLVTKNGRIPMLTKEFIESILKENLVSTLIIHGRKKTENMLVVDVSLGNGISLVSLLLNKNMAVHSDVHSDVPVDETHPRFHFPHHLIPYTKQPLPDVGEVIFCTVTSLSSPKAVYIQRILVKSRDQSSVKCNERLSLLSEMTNHYQSNWSSYQILPVQDLKKGKPCLARCSRDNKWHRAKILEALFEEEDFYSVELFFLDYGYFNSISDLSSVRELPEEHLDLPCMTYKCRLSGMSYDESPSCSTKSIKLLECLLLKKNVVAVVKEIDEDGELEVEMYEKKAFLSSTGGSTPLVYQSLIENHYFFSQI